VRTLAQEAVDLTEVTIDQLSRSMDLWRFPPVELVIRTKGDIATRLSGFLSRWIGYAELYFTSTKFPDFGPAHFDQAVERFDQIAAQRNYGK
jgi:undecaprenyl diphosphate synthase